MRRKRNKLGIFDRGSGWLYWQSGGDRIALGTKDWTAAELKVRELERRAASPSYAAAHDQTVIAACEEWLQWLRSGAGRAKPLAAGTLEMYGYHAGHFARVFGSDTPIARVDAREVDRYEARRLSELVQGGRSTVKRHTLAKERSSLRQLLRLGRRRGWYHLDLETVIPARESSAYEPLTRALTWEEVPLLLEALDPGKAAIAAFLIAFGADWVAVPRARAEDLGSAAHCEREALVRGSKSGRRHAAVPVVPPFGELADRARAWLVAHGEFPRWDHPARALRAACRSAGIPEVTPRDLRRTHGMILADRGVPPWLIGEMLRHVDGTMAERVYGQRSREAVGRQVMAAQRQGGATGLGRVG